MPGLLSRRRLLPLVVATAAAASPLLLPLLVGAAQLTWDTVAGDGAASTDGSGTWINGGTNWNDGTGNIPWTNTAGDFAIFGANGTAGTVTLGGPISVGRITFNNVAGNYIVAGNTLTLAGVDTIIDVLDDRATISSTLASTSGLRKRGLGTLELGAVGQNIAGQVTIEAGTIRMTNNANQSISGFYGASGISILNGSTLSVESNNNIAGHGTGAANKVPVTVAAGGTLFIGGGYSSHIRGLLTLQGGTVAGPGPAGAYGSLNFDGGVAAGGTAATSVISAIGVTSTQTNGTFFDIAPGAINGIDLDITGTIDTTTSSPDNAVIKRGSGTMRLAGANTYKAETRVQQGTLLVSGSIGSSLVVRVAAGGVLGGSGRVPPIQAMTGNTDAGEISPGEGAGILTAPSVQGNTGLDFSFQMNQGGSPSYGNTQASGNDLLRLTASTPFTSGNLSVGNSVNLFFDHLNDTYRGGFFAYGGGTNPALSLQNATVGGAYTFYVKDAAGSNFFGGQQYSLLAPGYVSWQAVSETAAFSDATLAGATLEFMVIPEPSSVSLVILGSLFTLARRRRG